MFTIMTEPSASEVNADRLFGEIAVRLFLTTRRDVERALRAQREAREAGGDPTLGEVMVGLDIISAQQVQAVLRAQQIYDERSVETLYGKLALKNSFISQGDLDAALKVQQRTGNRLRIGEVLVKKGYITWDQHEALLRAQERILTGVEQIESGRQPRVKLEPPPSL